MQEKVEISKVTLKVGGKDIELTLDQARELKNILEELFPAKNSPWIPPIQPIEPIIRPYGEDWQTWCDNQGNYAINCKA